LDSGSQPSPAFARRTIQSYEDLEVYQRSFALLKPVYRLIGQLPDYERYDLASQMRRAAKSVPANIAEGYAKKRSAREFKSFLTTAMGSANEMIVHLKIARELEYISDEQCKHFSSEYEIIARQLNRLIAAWRTLGSDLQPPTSNLQRSVGK